MATSEFLSSLHAKLMLAKGFSSMKVLHTPLPETYIELPLVETSHIDLVGHKFKDGPKKTTKYAQTGDLLCIMKEHLSKLAQLCSSMKLFRKGNPRVTAVTCTPYP